MNNIYIYKNDIYSLLNLIEFLINNNIKPDNIKNEFYTPTLLDNLIKLDINTKFKVTNKNIKDIILNVYLSNNENKELIIYYFYKNYLKYDLNVLNMYNLKCVYESLKISKYVRRETHKYKGFVRFKELENKILYAEIEPINNILVFLSNHFKNRLKNEFWIIKDNNRGILSIYDNKNFYIVCEDEFKLITNSYSNKELNIEMLWKCFYDTVGIKSRENKKCRMNFMPKRYWKYLIEMSDIIEKSNQR